MNKGQAYIVLASGPLPFRRPLVTKAWQLELSTLLVILLQKASGDKGLTSGVKCTAGHTVV